MWVNCTISSPYEKFHSCDFKKKKTIINEQLQCKSFIIFQGFIKDKQFMPKFSKIQSKHSSVTLESN
jgi:hypothetical protein